MNLLHNTEPSEKRTVTVQLRRKKSTNLMWMCKGHMELEGTHHVEFALNEIIALTPVVDPDV